MSVSYDGALATVQRMPDDKNDERIDLLVARQILAEVLEVITLSTEDEAAQDLALDALGLDRMYEGVLADVAKLHATGEQVRWMRRKDVERD